MSIIKQFLIFLTMAILMGGKEEFFRKTSHHQQKASECELDGRFERELLRKNEFHFKRNSILVAIFGNISISILQYVVKQQALLKKTFLCHGERAHRKGPCKMAHGKSHGETAH